MPENVTDDISKSNPNNVSGGASNAGGVVGSVANAGERIATVAVAAGNSENMPSTSVNVSNKDRNGVSEKVPETKPRFSFSANLVKAVVLAVISGVVIFWNFTAEQKFAEGEVAGTGTFSGFNYGKENIIPDNGLIRFLDKEVYGEDFSNEVASSGSSAGAGADGMDFSSEVASSDASADTYGGGATSAGADAGADGMDSFMEVVSAGDGVDANVGASADVGVDAGDGADLDSHEYVFKFNKGKFWGNFLSSNAKVNILVGDKITLIPNRAVFDAEFDGEELKITTYNGDVYLGFLDSGVKISRYTDKYSTIFMNRFVVPRDSRATIRLSKIDQRLKGLLYSRLFTEFKRSSIPNDIKKTQFVISNLQKDEEYFAKLKQRFIADDKYQGRSVSAGGVADFVFWAEENLTFVPEKQKTMLFNHLFAYLDEAIFYANKGDGPKVQELLAKFGEYRAVVPVEIGQSDEYYRKLDGYVDDLAVFTPADEQQYAVYKYLLDQKFAAGKDSLDVLDRFWLEVYRAMDVAPGKVKASVETYYGYLNKMIGENSALKSADVRMYEFFIAYQDQLFENLFLRYSIFYQDVYFAIKTVLEDEILSLYDAGQLRTELAQDFIARKIDFLRRLMTLFFEEDMDAQKAKNITSRLIEEVSDLMPPQNARIAVIALFEKQLDNLGDFWGYLNSVEYNSSKAYGATHKERYAVYLKDRDRIWSFTNVTDAVLGGDFTVSESSLKEMKDGVVQYLLSNNDLKNVEFADEVVDPTQRYVNVRFVFGGYPVSAVFDRYDKTLMSVRVYDQLITEENVALGNLLKMIDEKLSDEFKVDDGTKDASPSVQNNARKVAKLYLAGKIREAGFEINDTQIQLVDEENVTYRVEKIFLKSVPEVVVTFDFLVTKESVVNLYFDLDGRSIVLDGEYTLTDLHDLIANQQVEERGTVKKTPRGGAR